VRVVVIRRRVPAVLASLVVLAGLAVVIPAVGRADSDYTPEPPTLATVTGTSLNPAPWNEWQGDSGGFDLTSPFTIFETASGGTGTTTSVASLVDPEQVLPTYEPAAGQTAYPNVALDQGATAADADTTVPYQSGVVGTPGPLAGYCGSGDFNAETGLGQSSQPGVSTQPASETLPLGPDYFPHIVLNSDGSLTGYFDYRPKDENEAVMAATSNNGGEDWTFDQEALQQNPGYCASADTNDDGQGHPNVLNFGGTTTAADVTSGGTNDLFNLQRAAGDNVGVGMLVHNLTAAGATASQPLGDLPADQQTGLDPDAFDEDSAAVTVPTVSSDDTVDLTVSNTGAPGTLNNLVAGGFVDLGQSGAPKPANASAADVIQCTGVTASSNPSDTDLGTPSVPATGTTGQLTGCAVNGAGSITVNPQDMIAQVLGYVSAQTPTSSNATASDPQTTASAGSGEATFPFTLPTGPGSEDADGGYAQIDVSPNTTDAAVTSTNVGDLGFTYELTGQQLNVNAPDRYYIDGTNIYCVQSNNNLTTEIENCTVPVGTSSPSVHVGDPILADPIVPAGTNMTTGLTAPDGIVGELNSFPGDGSDTVPTSNPDLTYVMYDEKELNYYVAGELNKDLCGIAEVTTEKASKENSACDAATISTASFPATIPYPITFNPWEYLSQDFANQITVTSATGSGTTDAGQEEGTFTLTNGTIDFTMGDNTTGNYDQIQCTGVETVSTPQQANSESASTSKNDTLATYAVNTSAGSLESGADDAFTGCKITGDMTVSGAAGGTTTSFGTNTMIAAPGAALEQPDQLQQTGEGKAASKASNADKLYSNNEDLSVLRAAWTTDGVNFYSSGLEGGGLISGSDTSSVASTTGSTGMCASDTSYTDLSNPDTLCNPQNGSGLVDLNEYAATGSSDATEMRWPGSGGSIIYNPTTGEDELFLSGAWAGDGDSDAFNQVYYATSTNGLDWTVPKTVVSTDYSFSASEEQDAALLGGTDTAVGIGAYYSGRAYGPAVVPNPVGGGFWMVFAGYNVPKGAGTAGSVLNPAAVSGVTAQYVGPGQSSGAAWTVGSGGNGDDPAMYRNILSDDIDVDASPTMTFNAPTDNPTYGGSDTLAATSSSTEQITYSVDTTSGSGVCSVSDDTVSYTGVGTCVIDASQPVGDGYADTGSAQISYSVAQAPLTITASNGTSVYGSSAPTITPAYSGFVSPDNASSLTTAPTCGTNTTSSSSVGSSYTSSCSGAVDPNYSFTYDSGSVSVTPATLTVTASSGTVAYGASPPAIKPSYSGFANSDSVSSLTTAPTCSTGESNTSDVGTYPTDCSGGVASNYTFSYVAGIVFVDADSTKTSLSAASSSIKTTDTDKLTVEVDTSSGVSATGDVEFYEGSKRIKTVSLSGGKATYTLKSLSAGTHTLKAVYVGDASGNINGSTSKTITVKVTKPTKKRKKK
jgi:hypothetical protein